MTKVSIGIIAGDTLSNSEGWDSAYQACTSLFSQPQLDFELVLPVTLGAADLIMGSNQSHGEVVDDRIRAERGIASQDFQLSPHSTRVDHGRAGKRWLENMVAYRKYAGFIAMDPDNSTTIYRRFGGSLHGTCCISSLNSQRWSKNSRIWTI